MTNNRRDDPGHGPVLVTDFDGTVARRDFYKLVRARLVPPGTRDFWQDYRDGRITHFEAMRAFFLAAEGGEEALLGLVAEMEVPPDLAGLVGRLRGADPPWHVAVVSAGCLWYIDRLLAVAGVELEVHASPGRVEGGRLHMELPVDSTFFSAETGIDKAAVVRSYLDMGRPVAFCGDGFTDEAPARLVDPARRFARDDLATALRERGEPFRPFGAWGDVVAGLLDGGDR